MRPHGAAGSRLPTAAKLAVAWDSRISVLEVSLQPPAAMKVGATPFHARNISMDTHPLLDAMLTDWVARRAWLDFALSTCDPVS